MDIDEAKLGVVAASGGSWFSADSLRGNPREDILPRLLELVQAGDDQHDALRAGLEALSTEERTAMWTARVPNKIVFNVCVFLDLP